MGLKSVIVSSAVGLAGCGLVGPAPADGADPCEGEPHRACRAAVDALLAEQRSEDAKTLLNEACVERHMDACLELALRSRTGDGLPVDLPLSTRVLIGADINGSTVAKYELGVAYHRGLGVEPDLAKAGDLYERACTLDYEPGCYDLGILLTQGEVPINGDKAGRAFMASCGMGNAAACINVTSLIEQDLYEAPEPHTIASLKERACSLLPEACGL